MRDGRGCENLVAAMQSVPNAVLAFLGGGNLREQLSSMSDRLGLSDRVRFLPPVPPGELRGYTASADVGITLLEPTCLNHFFARPNKLFEYAFAGVPVLAANLPEIRSVVKGLDLGAIVDSSDPGDIARGINAMIRDRPRLARWSANCLRLRETFDPHRASHVFSKPFVDLLS